MLLSRLLPAIVFGDDSPRPGLVPIPGTKPLTLEAVLLPPLVYYVALLFLPPAPPPSLDTITIKALRNVLAILAGLLFFRLPLAYHVPQSVGLTYQLSLVGLYGGCRVLDAFFISPYLFNHIPRRLRYEHFDPNDEHDAEPEQQSNSVSSPNSPNSKALRSRRVKHNARLPVLQERTLSGAISTVPNPTSQRRQSISAPQLSASDMLENVRDTFAKHASTARRRGSFRAASDLLSSTLNGPALTPAVEIAVPEDGWPHTFLDRAAWALELELSMRGVGFTWTTADVRHSRRTWLPGVHNRLHSIAVHVLPILGVCFLVIRTVYTTYLADGPAPSASAAAAARHATDPFDTRLPLAVQLALTAALGAFLMAAFSFAHSLGAIVLAPLAPSPLAHFPPLYTTRVWDVRSVRGFWSYGWHRLFARLFLVYGVWPGEWVERRVRGKRDDEVADVGKVLGGFASSAFVHSFAVRSVLGGEWGRAGGEAKFFAVNGVAVVFEEGAKRVVRRVRKQRGWEGTQWYDAYIGRMWWITVLLVSGRQFARGWVNAGLVREMAGM